VNVGLFKSSHGDHLLIIIHHLVVDGVSWRILLEDFVIGYSQLLKGEEIKFQEKTDSYRCWADKLKEYAETKQALKELDYWKEVSETEVEKLPADYESTLEDKKYRYNYSYGYSETVRMKLDKTNTDMLLHQVNQVYGTEINDILLAALGRAVKDWSGIEKILLNLEGHGRNPILEDVDISRTVGWYTTRYPMVLTVNDAGHLDYNIISVKETLRRIPNKGIGYGVLRYLTPDHKKEGFSFDYQPEISFNYLGEFGQENHPDTGITWVPRMNKGNSISAETEMHAVIDINGLVVEGMLFLSFTYNKHMYEKVIVDQLVELYRSNLIEIIEHCSQKEESELTPSDFTGENIEMEELDNIAEMVAGI
jgi:non-ribosomal peptide synthase protein (TIGR01720 family)